MNELGVTLVWGALQVSVLSVVSTGVYLLVRRDRPSAGATAVTAGLLMIVVVSALAAIPWSGWEWERTSVDDDAGARAQAPADNRHATAPSELVDTADVDVSEGGPIVAEVERDSRFAAFVRGFVDGLRQPTAQRDQALNWAGWLAIALAVCIGVGLIRVLSGLFWVHRCQMNGKPIDDRDLREILDVVCAETGCAGTIDLHASPDVDSAATVGWRRPVILLPEDWRDWSRDERRSVLAHEVAHVAHRDSLYWMIAQIGLLLHLYHPLVHWLTGRLRLEQELAADETAARIVGDRRQYLTTLAELAVRQPDRPLAWPARTFLPTRGTLLRRIDMLRTARPTESTSQSSVRGMGAVAVTVVAGLVLAGFRPPGSDRAQANGQTTPLESAPASGAGEFNLRYVPPGVAVLLGARPESFAGLEGLEPVIPQIDLLIERLGFSVNDVAQVLIMIRAGSDNRPGAPPVVEVRTRQSHDFSEVIKELVGETEERASDTGIPYRHAVGRSNSACWIPNDRTILIGEAEELTFLMDSTKTGPVLPAWRQKFAAVAGDEVCCLVDVDRIRPMIEASVSSVPSPAMGMFQPLWADAKLLLVGANLSSPTTLHASVWSPSEEGARRLTRTVESLAILGQNLLEQQRTKFDQLPAEAQGAASILIGRLEDLLGSCQTEQTGTRMTATFSTEEGTVPVMIGILLPAIQSARAAARRTRSMNNLKQIMVALHNYHDVHKTFPGPAVIGPDGETKHSWRVAILPYLGEQQLYDEYDFSQPWNSERNKQVLAKIPPVFRHPKDDSTSTNASYFALVGEQTAFGNGAGNEIRSFTDGTSNTGMVFEAQRRIPWTKPEDVPFDSEDVPELGGWQSEGYNVGMSDGAVFFLSKAIDKDVLKNLMTRNDGNLVDLPNLRR